MRTENIKERLKVESIAERCRKARLRWFGHVKRQDQDYVGRKTGDGTTREEKTRKTEAEMHGLCQPRQLPLERRKTRSMTEVAGGEIVSAAAIPQPSGSSLKKTHSSVCVYIFTHTKYGSLLEQKEDAITLSDDHNVKIFSFIHESLGYLVYISL